jgi:HEPN domain-containing protein
MDEAKRLEIQAWLVKARQDLRSAEWLVTSPDHLFNAVGFHCQQSAEKMLKAYLTWRDEPFEKTHSLVALVSKCLPIEPSFESLRLAATNLTPYAVTFRYPGELPELTSEEAEQAIAFSRQVWRFVLDQLPRETYPEG